MEIEMFFAKYDIDGSRTLEVDEVRAMLKDLEGQRRELESKSSVNWSSKFIYLLTLCCASYFFFSFRETAQGVLLSFSDW